jgi:hypothetical protein
MRTYICSQSSGTPRCSSVPHAVLNLLKLRENLTDLDVLDLGMDGSTVFVDVVLPTGAHVRSFGARAASLRRKTTSTPTRASVSATCAGAKRAHVRPGGQDYVHEHRRPVHPKVKNVQIREILAKLQEIEDGMWN